MTKKMMVLALAAVTAALFAMPAAASATWKVDPSNQVFSGTSEAGTGWTWTAVGEPTITCSGQDHVSGAWTAGSEGTKGSFQLHLTNCSASVLGFPVSCKTSGAPLSSTILTSGTFTNVTIEGGKLGITLIPVETSIICGPSTLKLHGKIIGRIKEGPAACGPSVIDSSVTVEFSGSGGVQTPLRTDSMSVSESDDLTTTTGSSGGTATVSSKWILSMVSPTTWTCD